MPSIRDDDLTRQAPRRTADPPASTDPGATTEGPMGELDRFPDLDIDTTLAIAELAREATRRNRTLSAAELFTACEMADSDQGHTAAPKPAVLVAALANLYEYTRQLASEMSTRTAGRLEVRAGEEISSSSHLSGYCLACPTTWQGAGTLVIERARLHARRHQHTTVVDSSRTHIFQCGQQVLLLDEDEADRDPAWVALGGAGSHSQAG